MDIFFTKIISGKFFIFQVIVYKVMHVLILKGIFELSYKNVVILLREAFMKLEIVLSKISKNFNSKEVFINFSYSFQSNNIYKISGPNGSGKTTLFKIIKGIFLPDSGFLKSNFKLHENITYIDNNPRSFFHRLSVLDNLDYFYSLNNRNNQLSAVEELLDFFEIYNLRNTLFSDLSQGQMQLISIIRGLANKSKVTIFDESFSFLDKKAKSLLESYLISRHSEEQDLILYSSHDDIFSRSNVIEIRL